MTSLQIRAISSLRVNALAALYHICHCVIYAFLVIAAS